VGKKISKDFQNGAVNSNREENARKGEKKPLARGEKETQREVLLREKLWLWAHGKRMRMENDLRPYNRIHKEVQGKAKMMQGQSCSRLQKKKEAPCELVRVNIKNKIGSRGKGKVPGEFPGGSCT